MVAQPPDKDDPEFKPDPETGWLAPDSSDTGPADPETSWLPPESPGTGPADAEPASAVPLEPSVAPSGASRGAGVPWMLSGVLLVLVAAAAAYLSWPAWNQGLPGWLHTAMAPMMEAGRDTALAGRVDAVDGRVARLETAVKSSRAAADRQSLAAVGRLAGRLGDVEAGLARRLAEAEAGLASRVATLELEQAKAIVAAQDGMEPLARRLAALERRPAAARAGPAPAPAELARLRTDNATLAATMAALTRRLAALEGRPIVRPVVRPVARPAPVGAGSLLLAVGQLRDGLRGASPFRRELDAVAALAAGDQPVAALVAELLPHSVRGIASLATLSARFSAMAARVAQAALAPQGKGWFDQTLARLSRVITIRRTGADVAGEGAGPRLARAEARIAGGDLKGAVAELSGLKGAAAAAARPWLAPARARLAAEDAVFRLTAHVIAGLGAGPGAGKTGG